MHLQRLIIALAIISAVFILALVLIFRRRRTTDEDRERERRAYINANGRITDGTVIDAHDYQLLHREAQILVYQYEVSGVAYEASQDVTYLRHYVDLHSCRIGLPASVKYDPQNPGNSVVIAEGWSGLRV